MNCPICGYAATRVNDTYWCPNERIYIGKTLVFQDPNQDPHIPIDHEANFLAKFFDKFLWFLMGSLYLIVLIFVIWGFTNGTFESTSIFSN